MQLARTEQRQHHQLVEIGAAAFDADLLAHGGMTAVAADNVVRLQNLTLGAAVFGDGHAHATRILLDGFRDPAEAGFDVRQAAPSRLRKTYSPRYCGSRSLFWK